MDKELLNLLTIFVIMSISLLTMVAYFVISMYYTIKAVIETREIDREITVSKISHVLNPKINYMKDYEMKDEFEEIRIKQDSILHELQRIKK